MIKMYNPLAYLAICLLMSLCKAKVTPQEEIIRPVMYQKVQPGGQLSDRTFSGSAVSATETKLSFKVSGTIETLPVKVGQEVNRNSLIATLDDSDLKIQYNQTDANVKNADAQEKQAKSNFERMRSLYENGNTSLSTFESAKANFESAKANESSAKQARKLARAQLGYAKLRSPVKGKVTSVDAEVNENVVSGQQIVVISSEGDLEVETGLPESFISNVNVQDKVTITFAALVGREFTGVVSEVSFSINSQTSTYPVKIKLEGDSRQVRPGMAASITFRSASLVNADDESLIVSSQAVGEDEAGNFVFVLEPEAEHYLACRRPVTVGQLTSAGFEIDDGLEEGELIATAGLQTLLDSMKVVLFDY